MASSINSSSSKLITNYKPKNLNNFRKKPPSTIKYNYNDNR